jgi:hypothetical protein
VHRRAVVQAILTSWPVDPRRRTDTEWVALRRQLPARVAGAEIRNRTRQVRAFKTDHHGRLPACLTDLEHPPAATSVQALLAAADKQLVTIDRSGPGTAVLRVQLPLLPHPATRGDWAWHAIGFRLPGHVPADADLCVPTLRVSGGRVRVDLPWRGGFPTVPRVGHAVALGLDWGVNTLLTGTVGKLAKTSSGRRVVADGRRLGFDATGISAKLHRLRSNREAVAARRDRYARLLDGLPATAPDRATLTAKQAVLEREHERICARIRGLNHALAWAAARWAVDQAHALCATVVYVEDLATLEARGRRTGNARLSGQVRGAVVDCDPAPCQQARHRHRDGAGAWNLQTVPPLRQGPPPCASTRPDSRAGLEVGELSVLRPGWRPGPRRRRADRRPRPARPSAGGYRAEDR